MESLTFIVVEHFFVAHANLVEHRDHCHTVDRLLRWLIPHVDIPTDLDASRRCMHQVLLRAHYCIVCLIERAIGNSARQDLIRLHTKLCRRAVHNSCGTIAPISDHTHRHAGATIAALALNLHHVVG